MVAELQRATLMRGADGLLYAVSGDSCEVLKEELDQGTEAARAVEQPRRDGLHEDRSAARAHVDPGDRLSARAHVDPGDLLSARAHVDPGDQLSARAHVDPGDLLSARAHVDPGDR